MKPLFLLLSLLFSFTSCTNNESVQNHAVKQELNRDISPTISKKEFDALIDVSISLLKTKTLQAITDEEHIRIMLCLNTIFMRDYKNGRYEKLRAIAEKKDYSTKIINHYPQWIPNRGMGFYFPKLKMELYGTPSPSAIFDVKG